MHIRVCIFDTEERTCLVRELRPEAQMPLIEHLRFSVESFCGRAGTDLCWTDCRALRALNGLARRWGIPLCVEGTFRRSVCGGMGALENLLGTVFEIGRDLEPQQREQLREDAVASGLFYRTEPAFAGGLSVRITALRPQWSCKAGDMGVEVMAAQQLLMDAGCYYGALTGVCCRQTCRAIVRMQRIAGLPQTGRLAAGDWNALMQLTNVRRNATM